MLRKSYTILNFFGKKDNVIFPWSDFINSKHGCRNSEHGCKIQILQKVIRNRDCCDSLALMHRKSSRQKKENFREKKNNLISVVKNFHLFINRQIFSQLDRLIDRYIDRQDRTTWKGYYNKSIVKESNSNPQILGIQSPSTPNSYISNIYIFSLFRGLYQNNRHHC